MVVVVIVVGRWWVVVVRRSVTVLHGARAKWEGRRRE